MPRSWRLPDDLDAKLGALAAYTGQSLSDIAVDALRAHLDTMEVEADLLDGLNHDFIAATFRLGRDTVGAPSVDVVDVERRTTDPLGRPHTATTRPLTQFVRVEARADGPGRATIELVGLPHTDHAGLRVWVATVPYGAALTVNLLDLHPLSRHADDKEKQ